MPRLFLNRVRNNNVPTPLPPCKRGNGNLRYNEIILGSNSISQRMSGIGGCPTNGVSAYGSQFQCIPIDFSRKPFRSEAERRNHMRARASHCHAVPFRSSRLVSGCPSGFLQHKLRINLNQPHNVVTNDPASQLSRCPLLNKREAYVFVCPWFLHKPVAFASTLEWNQPKARTKPLNHCVAHGLVLLRLMRPRCWMLLSASAMHQPQHRRFAALALPSRMCYPECHGKRCTNLAIQVQQEKVDRDGKNKSAYVHLIAFHSFWVFRPSRTIIHGPRVYWQACASAALLGEYTTHGRTPAGRTCVFLHVVWCIFLSLLFRGLSWEMEP